MARHHVTQECLAGPAARYSPPAGGGYGEMLQNFSQLSPSPSGAFSPPNWHDGGFSSCVAGGCWMCVAGPAARYSPPAGGGYGGMLQNCSRLPPSLLGASLLPPLQMSLVLQHQFAIDARATCRLVWEAHLQGKCWANFSGCPFLGWLPGTPPEASGSRPPHKHPWQMASRLPTHMHYRGKCWVFRRA